MGHVGIYDWRLPMIIGVLEQVQSMLDQAINDKSLRLEQR